MQCYDLWDRLSHRLSADQEATAFAIQFVARTLKIIYLKKTQGAIFFPLFDLPDPLGL